MIRVRCPLHDCAYFNTPPNQQDANDCHCAHPDIDVAKERAVCPLYKKDWQKAGQNIAAIKALRKKR